MVISYIVDNMVFHLKDGPQDTQYEQREKHQVLHRSTNLYLGSAKDINLIRQELGEELD
jgi:hypothetical protein